MSNLVIFEDSEIRTTEYGGVKYYALNDVVEALTDSSDPAQYIRRMRQRDKELAKGWNQIATPLLVQTSRGRHRMNCADREGVLRVIQSISSPKAEPFKRWLAEVGAERLEEEENPKMILAKAVQEYLDLGYSQEWIKVRLQNKNTRNELCEEWNRRGIISNQQYAILTSVISKGVFGITPSEHKQVKDLKRHDNLRDHMTNLELIFTSLGEEATRLEMIKNDYQGYDEGKIAAERGSGYAGKALESYEEESGEKVISEGNFKDQIKEAKKKLRLSKKNKKK